MAVSPYEHSHAYLGLFKHYLDVWFLSFLLMSYLAITPKLHSWVFPPATKLSCFILDISFHSDVKCQGYEQQQKTLQEARLTPSAQTPMIQEPLAVCAAEGKFS